MNLKSTNMKQKLIGPFTQLLPMTGIAVKGAVKDEELVVIENGGIIVENNTIIAVDTYKELLKQIDIKNTLLEEVISDSVCFPGFIDSHTHICFGGTRANDYAMRNAGKTYLEISKAGGGIWDTVTQTRKASILELEDGITKRANKHLKNGVTTIEVKSGYGLSVYEELKMLRAIKNVDNRIKADLISTCLAAHMHPKDYSGTASEYLEEISISLFPLLKEERLTTRIDAFIEEGAFTAEVIAPYFKKAKEMGFTITVHADQFSTSGSKVAVDFNAISADHLEASTTEEINILAKSNVIATALPGASIGLGCAFTPARKLLDAGGAVAIASDHNPGSAPMGDLLTQASILGTFQKLSNAEVLSGITFRAAAALGLKDRGVLNSGFMADFIAFPTANYKEILYQQGQLKPNMVWKKGTKIA
ncbi:imidazolonepropionase [Cellulophaga geojensis KL-A]|uniref:Imidazolonepropionase n=2 Tax=Cellulophaga TaxID=104264 RepID=A0ABP3B7F9_9FLAO|nr:imidazolonepropionase [Cellulophaga geojensis KL-A]